MATKIKKEDFDKYSIKGFKIGDTIYIPEAGIQAEIMAVDLDEDCTYGVMIDAAQINLKEEDFIDVPIKDCNSDSVYYRKKALKEKYKIWVNTDKVEHVWVTHTREDVLDSEQEECDNVEVDADAFMIDDYLKDDFDVYSEFFLKSKYDNVIWSDQCWSNETYTGMQSLIEVSYNEAEYGAIVFDSKCNSNNGHLLKAILAYADRVSKIPDFYEIMLNQLSLANDSATVKDVIESIVENLYAEDIIHSYRWNSNGMCAVLVKL